MFSLSYWRPWDENSSLVNSWGDYLRDTSLVAYGAGIIGKQIEEASRKQTGELQRIGYQLEEVGYSVKDIQQAARMLNIQVAEVQLELSELNRRAGIALEQRRLGLMLQNNIVELLKIPDSEKERQQAITWGMQFFVNAAKDPDLFDDALEEFLKAEQLKKQDYFVLHRIGCIYLYAEKHLDPQRAADYFVRAGKYAAVESSPEALRIANILTNSVNEKAAEELSDPEKIRRLAADSYEKAAFAYYVVGDDASAITYQQKALSCDDSAGNHFSLAKYLFRAGQTAQAMEALIKAINRDPAMMAAVFCDADVASVPEAVRYVRQIDSASCNWREEVLLDSLQSGKRSDLKILYKKFPFLSKYRASVDKKKWSDFLAKSKSV